MPEEYKSKIPENNRLAIENIKDDIENGYTALRDPLIISPKRNHV